jgi:hypothetical protein
MYSAEMNLIIHVIGLHALNAEMNLILGLLHALNAEINLIFFRASCIKMLNAMLLNTACFWVAPHATASIKV